MQFSEILKTKIMIFLNFLICLYVLGRPWAQTRSASVGAGPAVGSPGFLPLADEHLTGEPAAKNQSCP